MPRPGVLCYDYWRYENYVLPEYPETEYVHKVTSIWYVDLRCFGSPAETPTLTVWASFLASNQRWIGTTTTLPGFLTLHLGGSTGMPPFIYDGQTVVSDDELITATSGTQVFNVEVPWQSGSALTEYEVEGTVANPGGFAVLRFGTNSCAAQAVVRKNMMLVVRAT